MTWRRVLIAISIAAVVVLAIVIVRRHRTTLVRAQPPALHVPRIAEPPKIDGELEDVWQKSGRRTLQNHDGADARPYSDVRVLWSTTALHVALYAADRNIVTAGVPADGPVWRGDAFHLVFTQGSRSYAIDVDPKCTITDGQREAQGPWNYAWQSGAHAACDIDGTIDHPGDNDEEWVVEMSVPIASLGLRGEGESIELSVRRCDIAERGGKPLDPQCPSVNVSLVLDP